MLPVAMLTTTQQTHAHPSNPPQKQGALRIATPDGAPPTPPLQSWSFSIERYMQYLVDQLTVHSALERSVVAVAAAPAPSAAAVESFAPTATALARSLEVSRDLSAMAIAMPDGDVVRMHPTQQVCVVRTHVLGAHHT